MTALTNIVTNGQIIRKNSTAERIRSGKRFWYLSFYVPYFEQSSLILAAVSPEMFIIASQSHSI